MAYAKLSEYWDLLMNLMQIKPIWGLYRIIFIIKTTLWQIVSDNKVAECILEPTLLKTWLKLV